MNPRVKELFHELADLPAEAREHYLAERQVDAETRHEVEELLAFDSGASTFLMHDVSVAAGRSLPQLDPKGWRCGPYRLLEAIGRGGMGAVYLAERADGEVTQRVAVKLLPPGAGDPQRERFLQERQILASLTHPNIARMMDAGHVENGQPFLAMEYIDGQSIEVFAAGLSVRQKIALFAKVCGALGYLHRNLVVHRDLKPSNILVSPDGEPKLLDFGIAKMLDVSTDSTMTGMRMLTPDYASPEQVIGGRVSTATDIYSLGAVLYKLLTGNSPHEFEERNAEGIASAITAREAILPSKRTPELKGDLDFILLKALRKDPQERYATVEQFAEDLAAFLESRTVRARSGNAWYRARKFARRYRVPGIAAGLVVASLAIGLAVANRQRMVAQHRFQELHTLSTKVFDLDRDIRNLPGSTQARQRLVSTSLEYLERLAADARGDLDLALEIAKSYERVAEIQGVPTWNNLGEFGKAEESLQKAGAFIETVLRARPWSAEALVTASGIAEDRMILASSERRDPDTLTEARMAAQYLDKPMSAPNPPPTLRSNAARLYVNVALAYMNMHRYDDAVRYAGRGVELTRALPSAQKLRAAGLSVQANALRSNGDMDGAFHAIQEARVVAEEAPYVNETERSLDLYGILLREGRILGEDGGVNLNRPEEAVRVFQRAVEISEAAARQDPHDQASRSHLALCARSLADILRHRDARPALEAYDLALKRLAEIPASLEARRGRAITLANSSYPLLRLQRVAEARRRIDAAFTILGDTKDYPAERIGLESEALAALCARADFQTQQGELARAVETYERALAGVMRSKSDPLSDLRDAAKLSELYVALGEAARRAVQTAKADSIEARRLDLWRFWDRKLPHNPFVLRQIAAAQGPRIPALPWAASDRSRAGQTI